MATSSSNTTHTARIKKDLQEFYKEPPTNIYVVIDDENMCLVHALIIGSEGTPYAHGFFYFVLRFPTDYPHSPPKVEIMTTSSNTVRFNPNLYANGKVCLSILGTWEGPKWCSTLTIASTLISIQSLMNSEPYYNEPGFEKTESQSKDVDVDVKDYNNIITHETLRVAVIEILQDNSYDARNMPVALKDVMICHFKENYQFYENLIQLNQNSDELPIKNPFPGDRRPEKFQYKELMKKIIILKEKLVTLPALGEYEEITKTILSECSNVVSNDESLGYESGAEVSLNYEPESDDECQ